MSLRRGPVATVLALALTFPLGAQQMNDVDYQAIARQLVRQMALTKGERVFFMADPTLGTELVPVLAREVRAWGGEYLGALATARGAPEEWATDFTRSLERASGSALVARLHEVDLGVMLPGAAATQPAYVAMQDVLRSGHGRTIHFHWAGAYGAGGALLAMTAASSALYQRALLETDYAALSARQRTFERAMRGSTVRVTTPAGTDLSFRIGARPVTRQDGDASLARARSARNLVDREVELPAGAVRVAPLESTVEGTIAFPDAVWGGSAVKGLVMHFSRGRLTSYDVASGREGVERELAGGGDAARAFREFALGLNPLLAIPDGERWIPSYGYGAGVVRLSLGDNTELGGAVGGEYVRWNFFPDATVRVGDVEWVRGGKLVARE